MLDEFKKEAINKMLGEIKKKILIEVAEEDKEIRVAELSRRYKMSTPLVTFHINMLVNYGLVERKHTARGTLLGIIITEKGKEVVKEIR